MPLYAYECADCGVRFERRQSFSDDAITVCPECGGHVRRLIQPAGIIFKGTGFYVTDNKQSRRTLTGTDKSKHTHREDKPSADKTPKADKTSEAGKTSEQKD